MLVKITDGFFIDYDRILFVSKKNKDIDIKFKDETTLITLSVYSTEGKMFLKLLNEYLGISCERKE